MTIKANEDLYGLVLAGGRSSRMGTDKGLIEYHQMPQRLYVYQLLDQVCAETFLALRPDQQQETAENLPLITDDLHYQGPFAGILAAHAAHPFKAWLVLACDLPFVTAHTLGRLLEARDRSKPATVYSNPQKGFPEPLLGIWEPEGLRLAKMYADSGHYSPSRFLESVDCRLIAPEDTKELLNVNSRDEYEQARKLL